MTEQEAQEAEALWASYHDRNKFISTLKSLGLSEKDLDKEKNRLFSRKSTEEAFFSLLGRVAKKSNDLHYRKMAHHNLAIELSRRNENFLFHLEESARYELLRYKQQGIKEVEILTAGAENSCFECEKQSGIKFSIKNALKEMPLPCRQCQHKGLGGELGFCRCSYVPVLE